MCVFRRRISLGYSPCSCASLKPMALHTRMARRQDEVGHWLSSLQFLLILAPAAAFSPACLQAGCQAPSHSIARVGEGQNPWDFCRLSCCLCRDRQVSMHKGFFIHETHCALHHNQEYQELLVPDPAAAPTRSSKHSIWSSGQLTSSLHWAVQPLNHSSKQLNWAGA